jgi:hypothetical protein
MNEKCNIAVKTPVGITDRFELETIEMQGTKFSNIKCSIQIDTLGKECYTSSKGLFLYKNGVYVPLCDFMIDVKDNFQSSHKNNMWCRICNLFTETQQHLVDCPPIREKLKGLVKFENIDYSIIFKSIRSQEIFAKSYTVILNARKDILSPENEDQQHE